MKNTCDKCKGMCVMHAFSFGECEICEMEISTSHLPCDKICLQCAENNNLCKVCGKKL